MVLVVIYHQNLINIIKKKEEECLVLCSHKKKYLLWLIHVSEEWISNKKETFKFWHSLILLVAEKNFHSIYFFFFLHTICPVEGFLCITGGPLIWFHICPDVMANITNWNAYNAGILYVTQFFWVNIHAYRYDLIIISLIHVVEYFKQIHFTCLNNIN